MSIGGVACFYWSFRAHCNRRMSFSREFASENPMQSASLSVAGLEISRVNPWRTWSAMNSSSLAVYSIRARLYRSYSVNTPPPPLSNAKHSHCHVKIEYIASSHHMWVFDDHSTIDECMVRSNAQQTVLKNVLCMCAHCWCSLFMVAGASRIFTHFF